MTETTLLSSFIIGAAKGVGLPPVLLLAVCTVETGIKNVDNPNDGGTPSYGMCQVKLGTARIFNKNVTEEELRDPANNSRYAALYFRNRLDKYNGDIAQAIAAYNRGRVKRDNKGNFSNSDYVIKVLVNMYERQRTKTEGKGESKNKSNSCGRSRPK